MGSDLLAVPEVAILAELAELLLHRRSHVPVGDPGRVTDENVSATSLHRQPQGAHLVADEESPNTVSPVRVEIRQQAESLAQRLGIITVRDPVLAEHATRGWLLGG